MPPKRKDKGIKGAITLPVFPDEPPQPEPGTPFCLALVIEVCLDATEGVGPVVSAEADSSTQTANKDQGGQLVGHFPLLVEPYFRYTFVNNDKITTPVIGQPQSSWTVAHPTAYDATVDPAPPASTAIEATIPDDKKSFQPGRTEPVVWRYQRLHQLQGADDEEVALALDRRPMMQVTLADNSLNEATAHPPAPRANGGTGNESSSNTPNVPSRNFIESWPLDLSAFLAGETCVAVSAGSVSAGRRHVTSRNNSVRNEHSSVHNGSFTAVNFSKDTKCTNSPTPKGIHYMRISVSLANAPDDLSEVTQRPDDDGARPWSTNRNRGGDKSRRRLFCPEVITNLNPLSIKITSAESLPGVRIDAEKLQDHTKPTRFTLLQTHCKPVFVVCRPFPDDLLGNPLHPRILWTAGFPHRDRVQFDHTTVFLLGPMDRHRLEEWAEHSTLTVEVHDRDARLSPEDQRERILRLERMVVGGYDDRPCDPSDRSAGSTSEACQGDVPEEGGATLTRFSEPRDIYEVDEIALQEAIAGAEASGKDNAHGVASFRLNGLLDQSCQLIPAYKKNRVSKETVSPTTSSNSRDANVAPSLKLCSQICQRKRREIPKGGVRDWHLSEEERLVRLPGAYLDTGASLGVRLTLAKPLRTLQEGTAEGTGPATGEPRPFARAVFVVEYEEGGGLVREATSSMDQINGRVLKDVQGSLRAYRLTEEEKKAADDGTLDVVCGFMVIDEDSRTIVLEGLGGSNGGLTMLLRKVGRTGPNGQAYRALESTKVRFSERFYTCFNADLKKIRLRDPLPVLCTNPEIYNRSKVNADCFEALQSLRMLRKMDRLQEAADYNLFPKPWQLLQMESKYGESVSIKDVTGCNPAKLRIEKVMGAHTTPREPPETVSVGKVGLGEPGATTGTRSPGEGAIQVETQTPARRKAPTDSSNVAFEECLRDRKPRDFLAKQTEVLAKVHEGVIDRRRRRREQIRDETVPTDWCYGPQALTYVELKKAEMRERLAKDKDATYTYSLDYVSQTVNLVDEVCERKEEKAKSKAACKTKRGFLWPFPRSRQELITHPRKPSGSRIDMLKEPWVENELLGWTEDGAKGGRLEGCPPPELAWKPTFDTIPSNGRAVFGGLQAPKYERTIDTSMIGSRSKLPRGRQQLQRDPDFFRSVHLSGEGLESEKMEARRKELEQWRSKVVVDDIDFRVGKLNVRDTPIRVDRTKDILRPPINKAAFKMIRNTRLPSGKRAPLRPAPVSAFSVEPYKESEDFMASIRGRHREKWTTADPSTGDKLDFCLRLHPDRMKPKSQKACSRMKHPSLTPSEMRGPRWETKRMAQIGSLIPVKEKKT